MSKTMDMEKILRSAPLYLAVAEHLEKQRFSMHTPGHKGSAELFGWLSPVRDLTELPDTDSLFEASGAIAQAEALASRYFKSAETVFSAGGCTLAIQAMLACCLSEGDELLIDRCSHRSAVNCCALLGLEPRWLWPEKGFGGIKGRITPTAVELALREYPGARAVYITSPDYYGQLADIRSISQICERHGVPLLVDNAHGAHLAAFGKHPLSLGASLCACSAHKTLPVLTGGAYLSCSDKKYVGRLKPAMALFGSTSPSYLIMQSLDVCRSWLEHSGEESLRETAKLVASLRNEAVLRGFDPPAPCCDPLRLTLLTARRGIDGASLAAALRKNGIEPEHSDAASVILLCSPFDAPEVYETIIETLEKGYSTPLKEKPEPPEIPERACSPRKAVLAQKELLPCEKAAGRISAQALCPCPPGIPLVMPGEIITTSIAKRLAKSGIKQLEAVACDRAFNIEDK